MPDKLPATVRCPALRRPLTLCAAGAGMLLAVWGCGGSSATSHTVSSTSSASTSARATWASRTQQLCREKRLMVGQLGSVHITYAGIARAGLPAVKRSLDRYLARLLAILRDSSRRQRQLPIPPSLSSTIAVATEIDRQSQSATRRLRRDVASAGTAAALSAAFRGWIATSQRLAARGDALARQLNLPMCRSGAASA